VAGRRDAAVRRAAQFADYWFPYLYTPEQLAKSIARLGDFADERTTGMPPVKAAIHLYTCCHTDGPVARRYASEMLSRGYAQDFDQHVKKYVMAGTPEECRRRLTEYTSAGAEAVVMASACPAEYQERNRRLIADEVLSAVRGGPS
jgi:alkanesulfonate monooxygenase SsuD/methylene tetrahydromethanopterin reductase-like flavin-dependent oxidoreductase (luciferase family)